MLGCALGDTCMRVYVCMYTYACRIVCMYVCVYVKVCVCTCSRRGRERTRFCLGSIPLRGCARLATDRSYGESIATGTPGQVNVIQAMYVLSSQSHHV